MAIEQAPPHADLRDPRKRRRDIHMFFWLCGWGGVTAREVLQMPSIFIGPVEHLVGLFHERRALYGISYFVVSDRALDTVAPLIPSLVTAVAP